MAKKQTKTQKLKSKVLRQIRSMEKRGYLIPSDVVNSIKNANYSKLSSYQKEGYKRLYKESYAVNNETGDLVSGYKKKLQSLRGKKQKYVDFSDLAGTFDPETGEIYGSEGEVYKDFSGEINQTRDEREYYDRTGNNQGSQLPDASDVILGNVVDDFISQLSQEVPDYYYTSNGKKKHVNPFLKEEIQKTQNTLLNLVYNEIFANRKDELAWRLQANATEISELIRKIYTDSNSAAVQMSRARLAQIIAGRNLSMNELMDLEAEQVASDGYEEI